jgi:hypothetical protein
MGIMKNSDFDIDCAKGELAEKLVVKILTDAKLEIKEDGRWKETGNLYVEIWCWQQRTQSWEKSGLLATKSNYYGFVIEGAVLLFPTHIVIDACNRFGISAKCKIPPNPSKGFIITVDNLLESTKTYRGAETL